MTTLPLLTRSLFWWLPMLNYAVMVTTLAFQAPLPLLLPARRPDGDFKVRAWLAEGHAWLQARPHASAAQPAAHALACSSRWPAPQECSLAHLIGLFRLDPGESLLSLGYRGALADVLLWALARIQSHIFNSDTYDRWGAGAATALLDLPLQPATLGVPQSLTCCVAGATRLHPVSLPTLGTARRVQRVVAEEEARERAELLAEVGAWKARHAEAALEESRLRAVRRQRLARLKAATSDTSIQQLYAFLGLRDGDASAAAAHERPQQQQQQQQQQQPAAEGPPDALSEYEREALAGGSGAPAEGAGAPQEPVAAAPTAAAAAGAAAAAAAEESRRAGSTLLAWLRQRLRCAVHQLHAPDSLLLPACCRLPAGRCPPRWPCGCS